MDRAGSAPRSTRLMLDLRPGQVVRMAGCTIEIQPKPPGVGRGGRTARLLITAPADVRIERPSQDDRRERLARVALPASVPRVAE